MNNEVRKEKLMLVTTGTSLFESASWEEGEWIDKKSIQAYREWLNSNLRISHNNRVRHEKAEEIICFFEEELSVNNADEWAGYFAKDIRLKPETLRYSAELSTVFDFAKDGKDDWKQCLLEYFIQFISEKSDDSLSRIAAEHNVQYLKSIEGLETLEAEVKCIENISSNISQDLKKAFVRFRNYFIEDVILNSNYSEIVIIISGGYKIYPLAFAKAFCNQLENLSNEKVIRIVYRYEINESILEIKRIIQPGGEVEEDLTIR